jgi:hypothetical protein
MMPGEQLGERFQLEQRIGSGGMGEVFRARDSISGEVVAIKVIADNRSHRTTRFEREIKLLAELSHPGIVRYISHGVTPSGELFLVMEWLDGEVLEARLQRGPLTVHEAVTLATRVAEALGAAHTHGVVHRDLKPSNRAALSRCERSPRAGPWPSRWGQADSTSQLPGGDVSDRASRLLASTPQAPGELPPIALDEVSAGLLDARYDVIERDARFALCGEHALSQGARTLLGRPTSCVGRDWELGVMVEIFDECLDEGEARSALVTAAAGMGKSRLGAEFVRRVQDHHGEVAIWVGRGDSLRAGATLDLLAQALRRALGIYENAPLPERRDKIRARVAEHVAPGEQRRVTEFLAELVGAPRSDGDEVSAPLEAARQDAQLMSEQMCKAWLDFLQAETSAHPVLLLLEGAPRTPGPWPWRARGSAPTPASAARVARSSACGRRCRRLPRSCRPAPRRSRAFSPGSPRGSRRRGLRWRRAAPRRTPARRRSGRRSSRRRSCARPGCGGSPPG